MNCLEPFYFIQIFLFIFETSNIASVNQIQLHHGRSQAQMRKEKIKSKPVTEKSTTNQPSKEMKGLQQEEIKIHSVLRTEQRG